MNWLPLVSVIMPVYNGAQFVRETIERTFAQTYPHIKFVAVDDGSIDSLVILASTKIERQVATLAHFRILHADQKCNQAAVSSFKRGEMSFGETRAALLSLTEQHGKLAYRTPRN